nr:5776_t:CDS:2 [Entrophospora candida]
MSYRPLKRIQERNLINDIQKQEIINVRNGTIRSVATLHGVEDLNANNISESIINNLDNSIKELSKWISNNFELEETEINIEEINLEEETEINIEEINLEETKINIEEINHEEEINTEEINHEEEEINTEEINHEEEETNIEDENEDNNYIAAHKRNKCRSSNNLIPSLSFQQLVKQITQDIRTDIRLQPSAISSLQELNESLYS